MHEDIVHLHEGEEHMEDGVDAEQDIPVLTLRVDLEEVNEF